MNRKLIDIIEVVDYWASEENSFSMYIDVNEPTCWACGQGWEGRHDVIRGSYKRGWRKAPLQICHIVPKSLGGEDHPKNLVLMCKECHDLAPNTTIPEIMFQWMAKQSYLKRLMAKVELTLSEFDISHSEFEELTKLSSNSAFKEWSLKHSGIHWPQSGYSGLGTKMTVSTYVGLLKHYSDSKAL